MRLSPSVSIRDDAGRVRLDQLRGQLEALALARMLVAILEEDGAQRPARRAPSQPAISLWSASGSSCENAGSFAFSLIWVFQR